jgi:U3 small nucleolar RNA-associated protein 19
MSIYSNLHSDAYLSCLWYKLFDSEVNRKIKKEPALAMDIDRPMLAFSGKSDGIAGRTLEDGEDDVGTDVVSELWTC